MLAIDIADLHKSYGTVRALTGVTLRIEGGGRIVGLLGPNGAGKTTLVEIVEGLREPSSGAVRVLGVTPTAAPAHALRARLGIQLQSTAFIPELTTRETLRLFAALYTSSQPIADILERVALADKASALVRTLSGGQRQRLALAAAMLHDPQLYLLDEPTSGRDPVARRQIHDILRDLRDRGKTVILSSHHLDEIEALADRVVVLSAGRIVADDTPLALLSRAAGASTLWVELGDGVDRILDLPGATVEGRDGPLVRYRTSDPTRAVVGLAAELDRTRTVLKDIRLQRPTLEDVYVDLIGAIPGAHSNHSNEVNDVRA